MDISTPIVYVDHSNVREGKLDALTAAVADLAAFVEQHEPAILSYEVFFSDGGMRMTVMHMHADASSLEVHMEVAGSRFAAFTDLIELTGIDIYGNPGERVLEKLRSKAALLGGGGVTLHERQAGFRRFD